MPERFNLEKDVGQYGLIETKQINSNMWIKTKIINVYGDFIEVLKVKEYISSVLMVGDILDCRIANNGTVIFINAEVYNIKLATRSVVLKALKMQKLQNYRKHKRYDIFIDAAFLRLGEVNEHYCVVVNLSLGGFGIVTKSSLCKGDVIELTTNYRDILHSAFQCEVRWTQGTEQYNYYGLAIVSMDDKSKSQFNGLIKRLQRLEQIKSRRIEI